MVKVGDFMLRGVYETGVPDLYDTPAPNSQETDINKLVKHNRVSSQRLMGNGKTRVMVEVISAWYNAGLIQGGVIVCPNPEAWVTEFLDKFGFGMIRDARFEIVSSDDRRGALLRDTSVQFYLVSYSTVGTVQFKANIKEFVRWRGEAVLVIDEVHKVQNPAAKITQTVIGGRHGTGMCEMFNYRACMTATPVERGYENLYTIFRALFPSTVSSYTQWVDTISFQKVLTGASGGRGFRYKKIVAYKMENVHKYLHLLDVFGVKGVTQRVADKKEKLVVKKYVVDSDDAFMNIYKKFCMVVSQDKTQRLLASKLIDMFLQNPLFYVGDGLEQRLTRFPTGRRLETSVADIQKFVDVFRFEQHPKMRFLVHKIVESDKRFIVWFKYPVVAQAFYDIIKKLGVHTLLLLSGNQKGLDYVHEGVQRFGTGQHRVLVTTQGVLKEAHSIKGCCHGVYFSPLVSYKSYTQINGRMYGIDRGIDGEDTVMSMLMLRGTIDETIGDLLGHKKSLDAYVRSYTAQNNDARWRSMVLGRKINA